MGGQPNLPPTEPNPVERPRSTSLISGCQFSAGAYDLKVRRKLLQQQIHVVDERCKRITDLLWKKRVTKNLSEVEDRSVLAPRKKPSTGNGPASTENSHRHGLEQSHHQAILPIVPGAGTSGGCQDGPTVHANRGLMKLQELPTAAPFRKGGWIDHANKKYRLKEKQREMRKETAARKISHEDARKTQKALHERLEIQVMPSTFPGRYLRGEVPCSKHFSAGAEETPSS